MIAISENSQISLFTSCIHENMKYIDIQQPEESSLNLTNGTKWINNLRESFRIERIGDELIRIEPSNNALKLIEKCLSEIEFDPSEVLHGNVTAVTELYRSLRNSATSEHVQNYISSQTGILTTTKKIMDMINEDTLCLKIILQFLINLITSNMTIAQKLHEQFSDLFNHFINEGICTYECSALIHNISLFIPPDMNTIETMFHLWDNGDQNEFLLFFIENCIGNSEFWDIYAILKPSNRLLVLETLRTKQIQGKPYCLPMAGINILVNSFLRSPDIFFKINNRTEWGEVRETQILLEIISSLSSEDDYISILQGNKNILVTAAALLINFHRQGKDGCNLFTPVQKLSESGPDESSNPVFGLKVDLIRLIGNMCWRNNSLQNLAREAEIIPVILDCCNIDGKNPFIIQWCIFAIRNLCDNNIKNQKVILGLHQKGTVASEVLDEFGITMHADGENQIKIVPLDSLK